jgi:hypothetical protein
LEDRCVPSIDLVTNLSGSAAVAGSLPFEVANAAPGDTIQFAASLNGGTINLANTLDVSKDLTVDGAGSGITVNGGGVNRVFLIEAGNVVGINGLTITGGAPPPGFDGGGIYNKGTLSLSNSTVTGNSGGSAGIYNAVTGTMTLSGDTVDDNSVGGPTGQGGGIGNVGTMTILNSTITANTANQGGGIVNVGVLKIANSTVAYNSVTGPGADGGGIYGFGGSQLSFLNTIVFNPSSGAGTENDVYGPQITEAQNTLFGSFMVIASGGDHGGNQFNVNPLLGPLQNNGGPTATMAVLHGSPAIGAGAGTSLIAGLSVPTSDQRGDPRPANSTDIGAFQTQPSPGPAPSPSPTPGSTPRSGPNAAGFNALEVALDALLVADGMVNHNAFLVAWGLGDYSRLLGTLDSSGHAQAQAAFDHDLMVDYALLSGTV